jgi:toxin YoeB
LNWKLYGNNLIGAGQKGREYWKKSGNKAIMNRITALLKDIMEHPYTGMGKPEALKYDLAGKWSRRINSEHRLIYSVNEDIITVYVFSMRYHYSKK